MMKDTWFYKSLLIFIQLIVIVTQYYVSAEQDIDEYYFGPYKQVYPFVDITQKQQNCSVAKNGTCPLYVALMMSFGGEFDSSGVIPGVPVSYTHLTLPTIYSV